MKRSPMSRGTGFKRREFAVTAALAPDRKPTSAPRPAMRRGSYAAPAPVAAIPKTPRREIPHLLDMANGKPCLFQIRDICNHNPATTVAAHSNWSEHGGKGGARKADDCYSAWACHACHTWLDSGPADGELKKVTFMFAHLSQVQHWRAIASDPASKPRDRAAVLLALDHLNATPVGQGETL